MARHGKQCVNYHLQKSSHIVLTDRGGHLGTYIVRTIVDDNRNGWNYQQLAASPDGKRLPIRISRRDGVVTRAASAPYSDDLGELTVTVTDGLTGPPEEIAIEVDYVDDPTAP